MEALPRVHKVSMISSSSLANFGPAISSPTNVFSTTTCVVVMQAFFGKLNGLAQTSSSGYATVNLSVTQLRSQVEVSAARGARECSLPALLRKRRVPRQTEPATKWAEPGRFLQDRHRDSMGSFRRPGAFSCHSRNSQ